MPRRAIADGLGLKAVSRLLAFLTWLALGGSSQAANLFVNDYQARNDPSAPFFEPVCNLKLAGSINEGDHERIKRQLEAFISNPRRGPQAGKRDSNALSGFNALCLASDGGDIREALKIAGLFTNWMRVVEAGDRCVSACAVLFMKVNRRDDPFRVERRASGRFLHVRGRLGFHAPRLQIGADAGASYSSEEVEQAYARALRTIGTILFSNVVGVDEPGEPPADAAGPTIAPGAAAGQLADDRFIPPDLLLTFLAVPPEEVYWITTVNEAMLWGIELYGFAPPRFISRRMLQTACVNAARARCIYGGGRRQCLGARRQPLHTNHAALPRDFFEQLDRSYSWRIETHSGTPGGRLRLAGLSLGEKSGNGEDRSRTYCEAVALYDRDRLLGLRLETFNGRGTWARQPSLLKPDPQVIANTEQDLARSGRLPVTEDHLRPWKMLPAGRKLADLGSDPWAELETGGPLLPP